MPEKTIYIVSGFMRCGTSMMMQALAEGGMEAVYSEEREHFRRRFSDGDYDPNRGGLYELARNEYTNSEFPRKYKGKLIKCLMTGLPQMRVCEEGIRIVFMRRDEEEIRQSYQAFFGRPLGVKKGRIHERANRVLEIIKNRKDVLSVDEFWYREAIENPTNIFEKLKQNKWEIDVEKSAKIIDPKQCRFRKENLIKGI